MSRLPSEIVRLYDLETLDLRNTHIEELPARIILLSKLQHLLTETDSYYIVRKGGTKIPNGIGNMRNLEVISGFNIIKSSLCAVEELGNLTSLKELHLQLDGGGSQEYKRHEEMLLSSICNLGTCKLQSLWICSSNSTPFRFLDSWSPLPYNLQIFIMGGDYYLPKLPKWIVPALASLTYLDINLIEATEEDLRILGEMSALLCLSLAFSTVQKERLALQGVGFPCLKEFCLIRATHCASAIYLTFEEGAMPKLEKLALPLFASVAEEYGFYLGLGHLPFLRDAIVTLCNDADTSFEIKSAAAAAIRKEANGHPNHPMLSIYDRTDDRYYNSDEEENYSDEE
uniref:Disease resistance R13L4/SHOC-2-like LRR domain-containing protein n=1 Tax=Aegilops tauschii subsp. strangulata TaxID=200361 RepID=A0A453Q1J1_AEGTS